MKGQYGGWLLKEVSTLLEILGHICKHGAVGLRRSVVSTLLEILAQLEYARQTSLLSDPFQPFLRF